MIRKLAGIAAAAALALAAPVAAESAGPTDAQIAHIAYTAGQLDVEAARLALDRTRNADVRAFAETMIRDHEAVNQQALALVQRLGVTPQDNPTSEGLAAEANETRQRLGSLEDAEFDRAYAENEAAFHRTVNGALSSTLIPNADNADLRTLLESGLALFSQHQGHAEELARQLR